MMDTPSAEAMQGFEGYRLSPQQRAVWLAQQAGSGNAFRAQCMLMLAGDLNTEALRRAFERIVARHQILRTRFRSLPGMAIPLQVVGDGAAPWEAIDLSDCDSQT
ncbi:MAG: condensation domain-containing protein, partial [Burkholderiales bacterium]